MKLSPTRYNRSEFNMSFIGSFPVRLQNPDSGFILTYAIAVPKAMDEHDFYFFNDLALSNNMVSLSFSGVILI